MGVFPRLGEGVWNLEIDFMVITVGWALSKDCAGIMVWACSVDVCSVDVELSECLTR